MVVLWMFRELWRKIFVKFRNNGKVFEDSGEKKVVNVDLLEDVVKFVYKRLKFMKIGGMVFFKELLIFYILKRWLVIDKER